MGIPVLAYYILFHYKPLFGAVIAFKDYKPRKGISGSEFVGLKWFIDFLTGPYAWRVIRNTLVISAYSIIFAFPAPILLALMINEVKCTPFKKTVQTVSYMPHFISLIVMCGLLTDFCSSKGIFSTIGAFFGAQPRNYLASLSSYRTTMWPAACGSRWAGAASSTWPHCQASTKACMKRPPLTARDGSAACSM